MPWVSTCAKTWVTGRCVWVVSSSQLPGPGASKLIWEGLWFATLVSFRRGGGGDRARWDRGDARGAGAPGGGGRLGMGGGGMAWMGGGRGSRVGVVGSGNPRAACLLIHRGFCVTNR